MSSGCTIKHTHKFVDCGTCVVYKIPLSCGKVYTGQTGRCVNDRAREHKNSLRSVSDQNNLPRHCRQCVNCVPALNHISVIGKGKSREERKLLKAYHIRRQGVNTCISAPSVFLTNKEFRYLDNSVRV